MALIAFHYTRPGPDGVDVPAKGYLICRLLAREIVGGAYRTVAAFSVQLVDGRTTAELSATGPAQCWQVTEGGQIAEKATRYVAVTADAAYTALVDVDPASFLAGAEPVAAWVASLDALAAEVALVELGGAPAWDSVTGKPAEFPPAAHEHLAADVTDLQALLDAKQAAGSYAAAVHSHVAADVTDLQALLDGKQAAGSYAAEIHGHAIADVAGLQAALDAKQTTAFVELTQAAYDALTPVAGTLYVIVG